MKIITLSREFGSGGRELGKRLADILGFAYYDKEIISEIAEKMKMDEQYLENKLDRGFTVNYPYTFRRSFSVPNFLPNQTSALMAEQHKMIRCLAGRGDCVIVGRSADVILADFRPLKLFVYGEMSAKLERCQNRASENEKLSEREMRRKIKQIDKARADSHDLISPYAWGDKCGYHLCINTTGIEIKSAAPKIASYADYWFEKNNCAQKRTHHGGDHEHPVI